jgi:hypothetical protein
MRPLEITRRAISNWSDAETTALAIAIKQATEACSARTPAQFTGDDLIAYARLCALGQQWPTVLNAATSYITSTDASKPQLAQAYAYQIGAALHTNEPKAILADSVAMLNAVPYTSIQYTQRGGKYRREMISCLVSICGNALFAKPPPKRE